MGATTQDDMVAPSRQQSNRRLRVWLQCRPPDLMPTHDTCHVITTTSLRYPDATLWASFCSTNFIIPFIRDHVIVFSNPLVLANETLHCTRAQVAETSAIWSAAIPM